MGIKQFGDKCKLLQKECAHCLELEIIKVIFEGNVQFAQTKLQPLIPNGTIKLSKEIQKYLLSLHPSLTINNWCEIQKKQQKLKDSMEKKKRKRTGNAKLLVKQLKESLNKLLDISQNKLKNNDTDTSYCNNNRNCIHSFVAPNANNYR